MNDLHTLDIKILLKAYEKPLSKTDISQIFWKTPKKERDHATNKLLSLDFMELKIIPKPKVKKAPSYFFLLPQGREWIKNYIEELP